MAGLNSLILIENHHIGIGNPGNTDLLCTPYFIG